jgi:hypothetical protein
MTKNAIIKKEKKNTYLTMKDKRDYHCTVRNTINREATSFGRIERLPVLRETTSLLLHSW